MLQLDIAGLANLKFPLSDIAMILEAEDQKAFKAPGSNLEEHLKKADQTREEGNALDKQNKKKRAAREKLKKPGGVKLSQAIANVLGKPIAGMRLIKGSAGQITGCSFLLDDKITEVDDRKSITGVKTHSSLSSSEVTKIEDFSGSVDIVLFLDTFKAVFNPYPSARGTENEIAFSLDWISNNSPVMDCHWFGVEKNSKLGWVMYEADRLLKCLHMGRDNLTGEIYSSKTLPIPGYKNIVERIKENPKLGKFNSFRAHRFWWTTQHMKLSISTNNDRIFINSDQHPIVQCELMNGLVASESTGTSSEYDQIFVNWVNANYELLAEKFSVLKDLRRAAYYYGFAVWMKKSGLDVNLAAYVSPLPENIAPLTSPIIKSAPFRK